MKINKFFKVLFIMLMSLEAIAQIPAVKSAVGPDVTQQLQYCVTQATKAQASIPQNTSKSFPRSIEQEQKIWGYTNYRSWTSGFWPGILWYLYENTQDEKWRVLADRSMWPIAAILDKPTTDHDLGFRLFNSFGNGYRLTENPAYKTVLLKAADSLATLFNPKVGTLHSWPGKVKEKGWPHNTIIDNMLNLELLFWASRNGGDKSLYNLAVKHAETTMKNHFRKDYSAYHVIVYDTTTGKKIKSLTHQGYADESMWARGQAWAIYGFTICYRETGDKKFLNFAEKVAKVYLDKLPEDSIPYWDFSAPNIPAAPKDASAAAVTASALLELSELLKKDKKAAMYLGWGEKMLLTLGSPAYLSNVQNEAFLLHSTGFYNKNSEIDAAIIYADYYYLEALTRLKKLRERKN